MNSDTAGHFSLNISGTLISAQTLNGLSSLDPTFRSCRIFHQGRGGEIVVINDPALVREVLVTNHRRFAKGPEFARVKLLTGSGMIVSDGDQWRTSRRLVQTAFTDVNSDVLHRAIDTEADVFVDRWLQLAADRETVDIIAETEKFALQAVLRALFSDDIRMFERETGTGLVFDVLCSERPKDLGLAADMRNARGLVHALLERRSEEKFLRRDIVDLLLQNRQESELDVSDSRIVDEIVTLIVAGFETSAILLGWILYFLSSSDEARAYLNPESGGACSTRIQSVANECLRLYPPVWIFSRRTLNDLDLGDIAVRENDVLAISPYCLHRRPDIWVEPERFMPNRFESFEKRDPRRAGFIPFSAGARRCIGDVFSEYEVTALIGRLAQKIHLDLVPGSAIELNPSINLRSRDPILTTLSLAGEK